MYRAEMIKGKIKLKFGSYGKLAKSMGVDRSTVTKWLNGSRSPNYHTAMKLTKILEITLEDIYGPIQ
jgi:DNA-binding XRE family transcriptional regulator